MRTAVWHNLPTGGAKRALHSHGEGLHEKSYSIDGQAIASANRDDLPQTPYAASKTFPPLQPLQAQRHQAAIPVGFISEDAVARIATLNQTKQHACECADLVITDGKELLVASSCQFTYNSGIGITDLPPSAITMSHADHLIRQARGFPG
jgi:hypothetical protein